MLLRGILIISQLRVDDKIYSSFNCMHPFDNSHEKHHLDLALGLIQRQKEIEVRKPFHLIYPGLKYKNRILI
jgi:hypothetical protein